MLRSCYGILSEANWFGLESRPLPMDPLPIDVLAARLAMPPAKAEQVGPSDIYEELE